MPSIKSLSDYEMVLPGSAACGGCPATMAMRIVGKALGPNSVMIMTPSCSVASIGLLPHSAYDIPALNICFASAGASGSGVNAAFEMLHEKGRFEGELPTVFNWTGDGGTYDIGLQALSAAAERNDNIIHFCYNNEAYSNTGVQRSGATPQYATTTTTPAGKTCAKKNVAQIMLEHRVPYVATASLSNPMDFYQKVEKAKGIYGFKYIEVHAPCYTSWKFDMSDTVAVSRLAVETRAWLLWEAKNGSVTFNGITKSLAEGRRQATPLRQYLESQGRFKQLMNSPNSEQQIAQMEQQLKEELESLKLRCNL